MAGKINSDFTDDVVKILGKAGKNGLSEEHTTEIIKVLKEEAEKGWFGGVFGTKQESLAMYITLIICICLIVIGFVILLVNHQFAPEYWKLTFPVITGALGYMYGKSK